MRRLLPLLLLLLLPSSAWAETIRFAVVVGNNAGRGDLPPLRYAETDAGKFARVLLELGDVTPEHLHLLQGKTVKDLEEALARGRGEIDAAKRLPENRAVVIFYFSGHSDGEGLELSKEVLFYSRLKSILAGVGDVRLVVVDACKSGAGFREKGGRPAEPFVIKLTDTLQSTGDAYISSSAQSEAALESNEVLGSIFTHHLISGLRGAADSSGDRLVTLQEAYRYAYDQTVARTVLLPAGSQHPSYDYRLSGQGELVLSTLERATAQLVLPQDIDRAVVTDVLRDQILAEISSASTLELAVPAGQYGVRVFKGGKSFGGRIAVAEGGRREVKWEELSPISNSTQLAAKGGLVEQSMSQDDRWSEERMLAFSMGIASTIAPIGLQGAGRIGFEPRLGPGLNFALLAAHTARGSVSESAVEARLGWRYVWRLGPIGLGVGLEAGPAFIWQQTGGGLLFSFAGVAAPRASVRFFIGGPFVLTLEGDAGVALLALNGGLGVAFRACGTLGFGLRF